MELITLKNKDNVKLIKDVIMHPYKVNKDPSGVLVETLRRDWGDIYNKGREFFMQYYSETPSDVARDEDVWHFHPTVQDDRFSVIKGAIVVAVADNRKDSETFGLLNLFYIDARENPYIFLIPRRTLHRFLVVSKEPAILINFPTGLYNPKEEERVSYKEADIRLPNGTPFNWDLVRSYLQKING